LAFTPDSRYLISCGKDETIRIWNLAQEPPRTTFDVLGQPVAFLDRSEECLALEQEGKNVLLNRISLNSKEVTQIVCLTNFSSSEVRVSPDAQWFATRSRGEFQLRPLAEPNASRSLSVPAELTEIGHWHFASDSQRLFASGASVTALWTLPAGSAPRIISATNVFFVTSQILCAQRPGTFPEVLLYDLQDGHLLATLKGHRDRVVAVASSPDGRLLGTGSWDSTVRVWQLPHGRLLHVFRAGLQGIQAIQFSPDGQLLAAAGSDDAITLWHLPTGRRLAALKAGEAVIFKLFFGNETLAAWFPNSSSLRLWRASAR
jgi:WD40 repeat protein